MHPLVDYFRCPEPLARARHRRPRCRSAGYFRFGDAVCYGRQAAGAPSPRPDGRLADVSRRPSPRRAARCSSPSTSRRCSTTCGTSGTRGSGRRWSVGRLRPRPRPLLLAPAGAAGRPAEAPAANQLGRLAAHPVPRWPVDLTVETLMRGAAGLVLERGGAAELPFIWFWPEGAPGCAMVTHDVEGPDGAAFCGGLMDLDDEFGIRSAFQVVPDAPWASNGDTRHLVERVPAARLRGERPRPEARRPPVPRPRSLPRARGDRSTRGGASSAAGASGRGRCTGGRSGSRRSSLVRHVGAERGAPRAAAGRLLHGDAVLRRRCPRAAADDGAGLHRVPRAGRLLDVAVAGADRPDPRAARPGQLHRAPRLRARAARAGGVPGAARPPRATCAPSAACGSRCPARSTPGGASAARCAWSPTAPPGASRARAPPAPASPTPASTASRVVYSVTP